MTTEEELEYLRAENVALRERVAELESQVQALREYLAKDSHNSSLPPSSDRFQRRPRSLRLKSGKKPGGQPGHPGHHLAFSQTPDQIEVHPVTECAHCHADLRVLPAKEVERRQIIEWPVQRVRVTEHRVQEKSCPQCQQRTRAAFPTQVRGPIQYGASLHALAVYLVQYQLLPYARVSELFDDLLGLSLSPGTIQTLVQQGASALEPVEAEIKAALIQAPVIHLDETGIYVKGGNQWVHVCSTDQLTHYGIHAKRGSAAIEAIGILPRYQGVSVHDGLKSYERYFCDHALCNVHHLRELTFVAEEFKQAWADQLKALLVEMKRAVEQAKRQGKTDLDRLERSRLRWRYEDLVAEGLAQNPLIPPSKRPGCKRVGSRQSYPRNVLDRLSKKQEQVLRFLDDFAVPFDNNQAERDLRMVKVQQKVSGSFRSDQGAAAFGRIRSYLSTLRKQGQPLLAALEQLLLGQPLFPALGSPSE
jgi:transposase